MKTQQVKPLPDTPAVIVNVFIKEEHHYHKGAVHLDFHYHFMAHLVSKLKLAYLEKILYLSAIRFEE